MGLQQPSFSLTALAAVGLATAMLCAASTPAEAVPSFARQTGLACEACHTVFPELTPFGRRFKLNAFTLTTKQEISDINERKQGTLSLADLPPLALMFEASSTWQGKRVPDSNPSAPAGSQAQNGTVEFPQQLSLFYGGKIADHFGALFQVTYSQPSDHFTIDNSDIRYADQSQSGDFLYGLTLNNNPTVQDVWNSTPAWGLPSMTPPVGLAPAASPLIGKLGAQVAGAGVYGMYKDVFYLEGTVYHAALTGKTTPIDSTSGSHLDNYMPYWRAAYERQWGRHSAELGTYGTHAHFNQGGLNPENGLVMGADTFTDVAVDGQYQYIGENHIATAQASWTHENQTWQGLLNAGGTSNSKDNLNQYKVTGSYYYNRTYGGNVTYTRLSGSTDALLYPVGTSANGSPNSQWETFEVDYLPFLNTKVLLQYTLYQKFNGGSNAYDGVTNRKASDNNLVMLGLWTNF